MNKLANLPPSQKQQAGRKLKGKRKGMCMEDRPLLEPNAAGIDIGSSCCRSCAPWPVGGALFVLRVQCALELSSEW